MKPGTISVVVPAYNAMNVLPSCLSALQHQTCPPDEIIVVDDGSTDETANVAEQCGVSVARQKHQGPAAARNLGIERARGDVILFTDADCEPLPDWVEKMTAPFFNPQVMGAKGTYRTRQTELMARLVQMEYERRYKRMKSLQTIDFIDTYAAAYRRELLIQSGGFDSAYPIPSAEDIDLAFRLARAGHRLVFAPQAQVWHSHPKSLANYLIRKVQYGWWRALLYLRYPEKTQGDAHTDPSLKMQFMLVAIVLASVLASLIWNSIIWIGVIALGAFGLSTLSFVRWAWSRDRAVALAWLPVSLMRVAMQGSGLALGLIWHGLFSRRILQNSLVGTALSNDESAAKDS